MAHDSSGHIFIQTVGGTTYGVEIEDLRQVLGVGNGDLGGIIRDAFARDLINEWAIGKPERSDKLGLLTLADRQQNYFGFDIAVYQRGGSLADFVASYAAGWTYLPPRGKAETGLHTQDEWYRIRDFEGYNKNANCFLNTNDMTLPTSYIVGQGNTGVSFRLGINTGVNLRQGSIGVGSAANPDGLLLIDQGGNVAFGALYFGLVFKTGSTYQLITSQTVLNYDGYGSGLTISEVNGDLQGITRNTTYSVYPCLSKLVHATLTAIGTSDYVNDVIVSLPMSPFSFISKSVVTVQNMSIHDAVATIYRGRGVTVDFVLAMSAQGGAATSMYAAYQIFAANDSGDTTGEEITSGSGVYLTTTQNANVHRDVITAIPTWVRIYAYNSNAQEVYTEAWVMVSAVPVE